MLDDTTQDNVLNILSKWNCTCGRRVIFITILIISNKAIFSIVLIFRVLFNGTFVQVTSSQTSTSEIPSVSLEQAPDEQNEDNEFHPLPLRSVKSVHGEYLT